MAFVHQWKISRCFETGVAYPTGIDHTASPFQDVTLLQCCTATLLQRFEPQPVQRFESTGAAADRATTNREAGAAETISQTRTTPSTDEKRQIDDDFRIRSELWPFGEQNRM